MKNHVVTDPGPGEMGYGCKCGLRFGEVSELRRKDLNSDCSVLTVTRAVTHRTDPNAPTKVVLLKRSGAVSTAPRATRTPAW